MFNEVYDPNIDPFQHSKAKPFCINATCDCKEDEDNIADVQEAVQNGELTPDEATEYVMGRTL